LHEIIYEKRILEKIHLNLCPTAVATKINILLFLPELLGKLQKAFKVIFLRNRLLEECHVSATS